jgi:hypothetical protein
MRDITGRITLCAGITGRIIPGTRIPVIRAQDAGKRCTCISSGQDKAKSDEDNKRPPALWGQAEDGSLPVFSKLA